MSRPIVLPVHTDVAPARFLSTGRAWTILLLVWFAIHFAALFSPPLLDDADAAHANAWFQCHARETLTEGFGLRLSGHKQIVGWWTADAGKLKRLPDDGKVICQQPETGD